MPSPPLPPWVPPPSTPLESPHHSTPFDSAFRSAASGSPGAAVGGAVPCLVSKDPSGRVGVVYIGNRIGRVTAGGPAAAAGVQPGMRIVAVGPRAVCDDTDDVSSALGAAGATFTLWVAPGEVPAQPLSAPRGVARHASSPWAAPDSLQSRRPALSPSRGSAPAPAPASAPAPAPLPPPRGETPPRRAPEGAPMPLQPPVGSPGPRRPPGPPAPSPGPQPGGSPGARCPPQRQTDELLHTVAALAHRLTDGMQAMERRLQRLEEGQADLRSQLRGDREQHRLAELEHKARGAEEGAAQLRAQHRELRQWSEGALRDLRAWCEEQAQCSAADRGAENQRWEHATDALDSLRAESERAVEERRDLRERIAAFATTTADSARQRDLADLGCRLRALEGLDMSSVLADVLRRITALESGAAAGGGLPERLERLEGELRAEAERLRSQQQRGQQELARLVDSRDAATQRRLQELRQGEGSVAQRAAERAAQAEAVRKAEDVRGELHGRLDELSRRHDAVAAQLAAALQGLGAARQAVQRLGDRVVEVDSRVNALREEQQRDLLEEATRPLGGASPQRALAPGRRRRGSAGPFSASWG
eukprot:TRINITY_DN9339_c0_g1_i1.p1 TRINITY_DN9339_c0_g1~~TRINITY_DN9339_c0_g1_i1.p1  ORF type:complete len:592 (+),score=161.39 TRINITY_DN9339_c0_g1_i1:82-1857(+)